MNNSSMTSMQRVLTTLSHQEPDRVPMFLLTTMHGAKEVGLCVKDYFSQAGHVVEGQLRLREKYHSDCFYPFFYAPLEIEAFGGEVIFRDDGPPNSALPCITDIEKIRQLEPPEIDNAKMLHKVLRAIEMLREEAKGEIPIVGVVMSPFSLPVMQIGFEKYLEIMHFRPDLFEKLLAVNETFCVNWANAQLAAGATAICYFDPVSSTTIIPREKYLETGFQVARRTIARIKGATATHFASGRCLPIVDLVAHTGTAAIGVSCSESIAEAKDLCRGKLTVLGNLNGITMRQWTAEQAANMVRDTILAAAPGGGFILADNHGEIPFQVPDNILHAISDAVMEYGRYPVKR